MPVFGLACIGGDEEVDVFPGEVAVQVVRQVKGVHGHAAFVGRAIIAPARKASFYPAWRQAQCLSRLTTL